MAEDFLAVNCCNVHFKYQIGVRSNYVLNGLNVRVPQGKIYGLLGSSGCGKTTLLKCIIGRKQPASGIVRVFGCKPGDLESGIPGPGIGYMPQEIALQDDMTILEIAQYFGRLYFMDKRDIKKKLAHLVQVLNLPEMNTIIGNLSSGQKRRVSFCLAIIHKPRLMILDEPTVGVDPILRKAIWEQLFTFAKEEEITIIVTTHYLEEMRKADLVGFVKDGRLLFEDNPQTLMQSLKARSLEEVFYFLCLSHPNQPEDKSSDRNQISSFAIGNGLTSNMQDKKSKQPFPVPSMQQQFLNWLFMFSVLTQKILLQTRRNPGAVLVQFIVPILAMMVYGVCIGPLPHYVTLNIVNEENPPDLSYSFLDTLNEYTYSLKQVNFSNFNEAIKSAKSGQAFGVIHIKPNFTESILLRAEFENEVDEQTIDQSTVKLYADTSNRFMFVIVERFFEQSFLKFLKKLKTELNFQSFALEIPIELAERQDEGINNDYYFAEMIFFYTLGFLQIMIYTVSFAITILVVLTEKLDNIFDRCYAAGVTPSQIVLAHLFSRFLYTGATITVLYIFEVYLFEVPSRAPTSVCLSFLYLQSVTGLSHGLMISSMFTSFFACAFVSQGILLTLFIVGGVLWPLEALPYWVKPFTVFSPVTIPTQTLRWIFLRGWDLSHTPVLLGFAISFSWTIFFLVAAIVILKISQ